MAHTILLDRLPSDIPLLALLTSTTSAAILYLIAYRIFLHPLRPIPGPLICKLTSLWTYYHAYLGDECTLINDLHHKYGPVIRIAPNEVSISDGAALAPIYSEKQGFMKAPCYANFDIDGHPSIFSALDPAHRGVRSKPVVAMFSTSSIRSGNDVLEGCVASAVARMKEEAAESRKTQKPVNMLNLARSLAVDVVSAYLFGATYGGIDEQGSQMSASEFVNAFVAVGRFFYLPNWSFAALEMSSAKLWPSQEVDESMAKVDGFVRSLVEKSGKEKATYQGRLLNADISAHETAAQCKDLLFAGTDSTGTNLGTICWHLAKRPDIYATLRQEVTEAETTDPSYNPQALPYLKAVIWEGLRLSMANPTRLPRIVPPGGWSFTASNGETYDLPSGTIVGLQIYTLHHNPDSFPTPFSFRPERWLENVTSEMNRDFIPFGLGPRQCIARNLAQHELFLAVRAIAEEDILRGARAVGEKIELFQWFNSKVKGERIDIVWT